MNVENEHQFLSQDLLKHLMPLLILKALSEIIFLRCMHYFFFKEHKLPEWPFWEFEAMYKVVPG